MTQDLSKYDFNGLERLPTNILRLISELEGSYQLCKYMGFEDDMNTLNDVRSRSSYSQLGWVVHLLQNFLTQSIVISSLLLIGMA